MGPSRIRRVPYAPLEVQAIAGSGRLRRFALRPQRRDHQSHRDSNRHLDKAVNRRHPRGPVACDEQNDRESDPGEPILNFLMAAFLSAVECIFISLRPEGGSSLSQAGCSRPGSVECNGRQLLRMVPDINGPRFDDFVELFPLAGEQGSRGLLKTWSVSSHGR